MNIGQLVEFKCIKDSASSFLIYLEFKALEAMNVWLFRSARQL